MSLENWTPPSAHADASTRTVVLITGGSTGIGKALAMEFARNGNDIFLVARDGQKLEAARVEIKQEYEVDVFTYAVDLAAAGACERLEQAVTAENCLVDILVNNAGVGATGAFASTDIERLKHLLTLNTVVPTVLSRTFLPGMISRARGGILSVASVSGHGPVPYVAAYGSSKGFLISLTQSLGPEVSGTGVTVSVLSPGPVQTELLSDMFGGSGRFSWLYPKLSPDAVARVAYDGFATGKRVIIPGLLNWFVVFGTKLFPQRIQAWFFAFAMRANTPKLR